MVEPMNTDWGSEDEGSSDYAGSDEEPTYEVERIIAERNIDGIDQYLVKWTHFGDEDCTWEPAESFDQAVPIQLWQEARARGDTLDAAELQDVERKMAKRQASNEKGEADHQRRDKEDLPRKIPPVISRPIENAASTKPASPITRDSSSNSPLKPAKRRASGLLQSSSKAESAKPSRGFYGLSDIPQTARRTTGTQMNRPTSFYIGKPFLSLSHRNKAQKRRRQEPAPDIQKIGTFRPVAELVPIHDVALNLPSGPSRLSYARNVHQETFVESEDGNLERLTETDATAMSPDISGTVSEGRNKVRSEPIHQQQMSHPGIHATLEGREDMLHIRYGRETFHHRRGEVVVQMRMGSRLIGHVNIVGLTRPGASSSPLIAALLKTKENFVLGMTFEEEDAYRLEDFRRFEHEVSAVGSIEPFDNAKDDFHALLRHFNTLPKAGLWRHDSIPWIMIIYSCSAAAFIEKHFPSVSGGLAFLVCRRPPWRTAPHLTDQSQLSSGNAGTHVLLPDELDYPGTYLQPPTALAAAADHNSQAMPGIERTSFTALSNADTFTHHPVQVSDIELTDTHIQPLLEHTKTNGLVGSFGFQSFEEKYSISYECLTRVPATARALPGKGDFQWQLVRFFLDFGEDRKDEENELRNWLTTRTPAHMVFSARAEHSWQWYKDFLSAADHVGIILIHADCLTEAFSSMSELAKRLRRENIQVFRVSLEQPLQKLSQGHFERIFPSGHMILVTESSMTANARGVANLLEWFLRASKGKQNWKLILRPSPEQYLRDLCEMGSSEDDRMAHMQSLLCLTTLQCSFERSSPDESQPPQSRILTPLALSVYSRGDTEPSLATRNVQQISERDSRLLEFFCGWSYSQVAQFRRFVAVTEHAEKKLSKCNGHVEFLPLQGFEKVYISKQAEIKMTPPVDSPLSPVVKGAAF